MGDSDGRTAQATSAAAQREQNKRAKAASFVERMAAARGRASATPSPSMEEIEYNDVQLSAHGMLTRKVQKRARQRSRTPPSRLGLEPIQDAASEGHKEATGCRLIDLDLFNEHITRMLPCPWCQSTTLFCRAEDEYRAGLSGTLRFWCGDCEDVTLQFPISRQLKASSRGPGIAEANARLVLGAAQVGGGETQMAQLCGTLNVPVVRGTTWAAAEDRVTAAVIKAAAESHRVAREEEKLAAFDRGTPLDTDGRVPITVEYDMCWA